MRNWSVFWLLLVLGSVFAKEEQEQVVRGCAGIICPRRFETCELGEDLRPICVRRCPNCDEIINRFPVCATDGRTYQSVCHVREVECMNSTVLDVACRGFCPCDPKEVERMDPELVHKLQKLRLKVLREKRLDEELARESASVEAWKELNENNKKKKVFQPSKDTKETSRGKELKKWLKLKEQLKEEEELAKQRVLQEMMLQKRTKVLREESKTCELRDLQQLPNRLVDWFHVLKTSELKRLKAKTKEGEESVLKELRFVDAKLRSLYVKLTCKKQNPKDDEIFCLEPVRWMFEYLDKNKDAKLNHTELSEIDDIDTEYCLRPFFMSCDSNMNGFIGQQEFCKCLCVEPPCTRMMEDVPTILVRGVPQPAPGYFTPTCDEDGFFMPRQCHGDKCWCVDRNGAEFKGTTKIVNGNKNLLDCGLDNIDPPGPTGKTVPSDVDAEKTKKLEEP